VTNASQSFHSCEVSRRLVPPDSRVSAGENARVIRPAKEVGSRRCV